MQTVLNWFIFVGVDEKAFLDRMDKMLILLEVIAKPPSLGVRIASGIATAAGILGLITIVDVIKNWFGG